MFRLFPGYGKDQRLTQPLVRGWRSISGSVDVIINPNEWNNYTAPIGTIFNNKNNYSSNVTKRGILQNKDKKDEQLESNQRIFCCDVT